MPVETFIVLAIAPLCQIVRRMVFSSPPGCGILLFGEAENEIMEY